jgi:hypoxanthine phosphoribosyltransferase
MPAPYEKFLKEVLISEADLQKRIVELGQEISAAYDETDDLLLICILKGGVMFLTDLSRHITIPHAMDFMAASSYGVGARSSIRPMLEERGGHYMMLYAVASILVGNFTMRRIIASGVR